jgi:ribosomal-protein-alanine N-acetyltransferase
MAAHMCRYRSPLDWLSGSITLVSDAVTTRLVSLDDVPELTALAIANKSYLAPWQPSAADATFTEPGQVDNVNAALSAYEQGHMVPQVIIGRAGAIVGRINLNSIIRGAFQSASVGYWVSEKATGRGVATAAVAAIVGLAFGEAGLHRLQGETLAHNTASRRVLERNGFVEYGEAPEYLRIAGHWQDHVLYQLINPNWVDG